MQLQKFSAKTNGFDIVNKMSTCIQNVIIFSKSWSDITKQAVARFPDELRIVLSYSATVGSRGAKWRFSEVFPGGRTVGCLFCWFGDGKVFRGHVRAGASSRVKSAGCLVCT